MCEPVRPQVFCSAGIGIPESGIRATYSDDYSRKIHGDYEQRIEEVWREKSKERITLYNKSKFRLHMAFSETAQPGSGNENSVVLKLGLTTYKDFVGTNCAPYGMELMKRGMSSTLFPYGFDYLANPLGVGALVETSDSKIVFLKRSELCAESPGLIDMPGGHPEPDEVVDVSTSLKAVEPAVIAHEIFHSILREVRDEVNIPERNLSDPLLLGICFNEKTLYRPSAEFYIRCSLSSEEILARYREETQPEKEESTDLIFVSTDTLKEMDKVGSGGLWDLFTSSARGGAHLLSMFSP